MTHEKAKQIYSFEMDIPLLKISKDALSYALQAGDEEANSGIKNVLFYFMETVWAEKTHRSTLEGMFEWTIEKCTKSSISMDASTSRTQTPSRLLRPFAIFLHAKINK